MVDYDTPINIKTAFLKTDSPRGLLLLNGVAAILYFYILAFLFPHGNPILFALLIAGELFHVWQVLTFLYTVWETSWIPPTNPYITPLVDVFITVAGEPVELVRETVSAVKRMRYPAFNVYVLNDGFVAKKSNWRAIEQMAEEERVGCITRTRPGGAKAGNINHALRLTESPLVAIFDADHVPHRDFLEKTAPYFVDASVGYVQTPQFYKNYATNYLTQSSWEQQELFFGPICKGKNRLNAATMCGTNMLISREALERVGGMSTESIAEDFVTGMFIHEHGYRSVYHAEVLAEGLATEDLLSYSKQQFRWARGALDIIFRYNPLFRRGLTFAQRIQYLASASFYVSGVVVLIDMLLPVIFFYTGLLPVRVSGMFLATIFLPYLFLTLYVIQRSSNFAFSFPSLALSMSSFHIHLRALVAAASRYQSTFSITPKAQQQGNFIRLVIPHMLYIAVAAFGFLVALSREGLSASVVNNTAWVLLNIAIVMPFIRSSISRSRVEPATIPLPVTEPSYESLRR